ncbi:alpha/beta hydrolase [Pollutimonas sp. M17]|uniref:alpha/beta hydrolase n=1 Tax=Pollutimonas sp. M17 TaxID=2962065 RepID=UPI0021F3F18A|nr:alpha/beta hydrolase [Pollutimonas sp. M17]UYO94429.1 alpha/beta hydrolase [Pollutimonas sp. M17]
MPKSIAATLFFLAFCSGCATISSPEERRVIADSLAAGHDWQASVLPAGGFDLVAYAPRDVQVADTLTVYIEGDGFAWATGARPSSDPTPRDPLALRLALAQRSGNAAYLARPCQYVDAARSGCPQRYWTGSRFSAEVVHAESQALDVLKRRFGAQRLTLVGYSGGGAVAALLAARRGDVERLITVAGNLDHRAWTAHHRIRPLTGSLDPADESNALRGVRQWHFAGGKDTVIPPGLVQGFAQRFPADARPVVHVEPGFDHRCCWAEDWPRLYGVAARFPG